MDEYTLFQLKVGRDAVLVGVIGLKMNLGGWKLERVHGLHRVHRV